MHEGKVVKFLYGGINRIVAGDYRVVFMQRDLEEVRQSYAAFFRERLPHSGEVHTAVIANAIGILQQRRDVQLAILQYRDVVEAPLKAFQGLRDTGWPIDPVKAAAIVDPALCRFRLEQLEVGIS